MENSCAVCGVLAVVWINGVGYCIGHVDDGFALAFRGIAILRGLNPDDVEQAGRRALEHGGDQ